MNNKKIIFQVTKTYMKKNKKRTAITFAGILVMVILMTAVFIGKDTVMEFMKKAVEADQGKWHYQVYDIDRDEVDQIKAIDSVDKLEVSRSLGYTEFPQGGNPNDTPFLELKGYSGELFDWMNIRLIEGEYPKNENEILLSERAIKEGSKIKVGDTIDVDTFDRYIHAFYAEGEEEQIANGKDPGMVMFSSSFTVQHGSTEKAPEHFAYFGENEDFEEIREYKGIKGSYKIVGIMESPYYESKGQGGYIALTKTTTDVNSDEKVNVVFTVDLNSDRNTESEVYSILDSKRTDAERKAILENGMAHMTSDGRQIPIEAGQVVINDMLLTFASKGSDASFNYLMIFFQAFFILLITAASLVLIYNVFSMSYKERSKYLGMLSSVGATRKQKRWSVYYEVFSLLLIALPLGIILGLLVVKGAMELLYPHFADIISKIATNVITGKSCEIDYRLIINPINVLFVIGFSIVAVWISAWIPALKISKVGPIESIRGNETSIKARKKGYKTAIGFMKKGKAESLLATASVNRNKYSTKGIIRSITAFVTLTLITAFAVRSFTDILKNKADDAEVELGKEFQGYDYMFCLEDENEYNSGKSDIEKSDEVSSYKEINISSFAYNVSLKDFSEEYRNDLEAIVRKYYPEGIPDSVKELTTDPQYTESNPIANIITLTEEDFKKVAENAGVSLSSDGDRKMAQVLVYDQVSLDTDEYKFAFDGAVKPGYSMYQINRPLEVKPGETLNFLTSEYDKENDTYNVIKTPVTFAGYVNADNIKDLYTIKSNSLYFFVSENEKAKIDCKIPKEYRANVNERIMLFNVNTDDSNLIRRLSQIKNEYGESALGSAGMISGYTAFKDAIIKIVQIVAICFTLLIALICLLNLYNSVMGRKLARHQELSVLYSMGMTGKQKNKMLMKENVKLLIKSFIYSGVITAAFVVCLRIVLNLRFGKMIFTLPIWMIILTAVISGIGLISFTAICYKENGKKLLIDEIRTEMV